MGWFVRKVPTASGATAVQIVHKRGRRFLSVEHVGSAHDEAELAVLMVVAEQRLHEDQLALDFDPVAEPARRRGSGRGAAPAVAWGTSSARVAGARSQLLWDVLAGTYARLGFEVLGDSPFRAMVLARLIEPTSKADTIRVLDEIGIESPSLRTLFRALGRCIERDYRGRLAKACLEASVRARGGLATLIMYDCTTLHFQTDAEDDLRRVGMSKERRVDPQIQVGLLVDPAGFPLEVHCFEGNTAETRTLIPVLRAFAERHQIAGMVVVADAGMLSAGNLNALEDAGFFFIVGSRISKAPYDLAEHFDRHGDYFADGQIIETTRVMGTGAAARPRRVIYQYSFTRRKRDDRAINAMVERAEKVADGTRPAKKDRFVTLDGAKKGVNWDLVNRARQLAGLKGYVTNLTPEAMTGTDVIGAYHQLWQVEKSFRMSKNDLRARPIFHHERDSIEAHLTVVFAALAIARDLQERTGLSLKKIITTLRPLRSVDVQIAGHTLTAEPTLTPQAIEILDALKGVH